MTVDAHGHALVRCPWLPGAHQAANHKDVQRALAKFGRDASLRCHIDCKNTFSWLRAY